MTSARRTAALAGVGGLVLALTAAGAPVAAAPTATSMVGAAAVTAAFPTAGAATVLHVVRDPLLRRGSRGEAVAAWQRALNRWLRAEGRPRLVTDGIFGPRTDAATRAFQRAAGITVDGIVGPQTRDALAGTLDGGGNGGGSAPFEGTAGISASEPSGEPLALTGVRVGRNRGYDRVVLDLAGDGTPGWQVEYVDSPVREQGSGTVVPLEGDGQLRITARGMGYPADTGVPYYPGPERVPTRGAEVVQDVAVGTLFEGRHNVYVGVSSPNRFRVFPLDDPTRLVVDILHGDEG